jgi:hypothetical protein
LRRLPDASREAELAYRDQLVALKAQVERIDGRSLRGEDLLNRNYLMRVIDDRIENANLDFGRAPISNGDGFFTLADGLAYTTPIQSAGDAEAWIARLEALPTYYEQSVVNARRGIATGYVQPRIVADRALATMRAQVATMTDTMLVPLAQMPENFPATQQEAYRARVREIVQQRILPAHQAALQFMEREYLPASRSTIGLRAVPGGEALYRYLVHNYTTTDMTPEQIHALGEQEVTRIRAAMEREIAASGFHGNFAAFQRFLRTDRQFYARNADDLVARYSEVAKRADGELPRLFGTLPRLSYGIRVIPAAAAEGSTTAYYTQGSAQLGQAGTYWVNTTHLDQRPFYEMPALTLHEAMPGHHLQISRRSWAISPISVATLTKRRSSKAGGSMRNRSAKTWACTARPTNASGGFRMRCGARVVWWRIPAFTGWAGTSSKRGVVSPKTPRSHRTTSKPNSNATSPRPARRSPIRSANSPCSAYVARRRKRWVIASISARSTMSSSAPARCRWMCWRRGCMLGWRRSRRLDAESFQTRGA